MSKKTVYITSSKVLNQVEVLYHHMALLADPRDPEQALNMLVALMVVAKEGLEAQSITSQRQVEAAVTAISTLRRKLKVRA